MNTNPQIPSPPSKLRVMEKLHKRRAAMPQANVLERAELLQPGSCESGRPDPTADLWIHAKCVLKN